MKQILLFVMMFTVSVCAKQHFQDKDMDGIPDSRDKCSYTPFSDLVDSKGCTVKTLAIYVEVKK